MTTTEYALYNISNKKVKLSCDKRYNKPIEGVIDNFWIDEFAENKINFKITVEDKEIIHAFNKPHKFEDCGNKLIFYVDDVEYIFELIK